MGTKEHSDNLCQDKHTRCFHFYFWQCFLSVKVKDSKSEGLTQVQPWEHPAVHSPTNHNFWPSHVQGKFIEWIHLSWTTFSLFRLGLISTMSTWMCLQLSIYSNLPNIYAKNSESFSSASLFQNCPWDLLRLNTNSKARHSKTHKLNRLWMLRKLWQAKTSLSCK